MLKVSRGKRVRADHAASRAGAGSGGPHDPATAGPNGTGRLKLLDVIIGAAVCAFAGWQLWLAARHGKVAAPYARRAVRRAESPAMFWFIVAMFAVVFLSSGAGLVAGLARDHGRPVAAAGGG
jgi:hypothetical protein